MVSLVNLDSFRTLIHSLHAPCGACLWLTGAQLSLASQRVTSSCGLDYAASHSVPGIRMPASAALHQSAAICPFRQQAEAPLSQSQTWKGMRARLCETSARMNAYPRVSLFDTYRLSGYIKKDPEVNNSTVPQFNPRLVSLKFLELQWIQQQTWNKQGPEDSQRPLTALIWVFLLINKAEQKLTVLENNYVWRFMMKTWVD